MYFLCIIRGFVFFKSLKAVGLNYIIFSCAVRSIINIPYLRRYKNFMSKIKFSTESSFLSFSASIFKHFSISVGCDYMQQADIPTSHVNRLTRSTGQETSQFHGISRIITPYP